MLGECLCTPFTKRRKNSWMNNHQVESPTLKSMGFRASMARPSYRDVFTFQANLNLLAYVILSLHAVSFDQVC